MGAKRAFILFILVAIFASSSVEAIAKTYTSLAFILRNARIVASGGKAISQNYSLGNVSIGNIFGSKAQSANYSLDLSTIDKRTPPNPPTLNPVTTPTNVSTQTLSGQKDPRTSIYINGYEAVPIDNNTAWSYIQSLREGENILFITSRNAFGLESGAVSVGIVLDTIAPTGTISINDGATYANTINAALSLSANDATTDVVAMAFSNDNLTWSPLETYSISKPWTLTSGDGAKAVYVKYKDRAGNWSNPFSDSIILDTTPASVPSVIDDGATTYYLDRLHAAWSSSDTVSGISEYQYAIGTMAGSSDIVPWTSAGLLTEITHTGLSLTSGQVYYFSLKAKNGAGTWSGIGSSDGIQASQSAPTINNITPGDGSLFEVGAILPFNIAATDSEGDTISYKIVIDGITVKNWELTPTFSWQTFQERQGSHNITVYVKDIWNYERSQSLQGYLVRKAVDLP